MNLQSDFQRCCFLLFGRSCSKCKGSDHTNKSYKYQRPATYVFTCINHIGSNSQNCQKQESSYDLAT